MPKQEQAGGLLAVRSINRTIPVAATVQQGLEDQELQCETKRPPHQKRATEPTVTNGNSTTRHYLLQGPSSEKIKSSGLARGHVHDPIIVWWSSYLPPLIGSITIIYRGAVAARGASGRRCMPCRVWPETFGIPRAHRVSLLFIIYFVVEARNFSTVGNHDHDQG